jgi:[acyl-carrier-protein] S-malonyltransferase
MQEAVPVGVGAMAAILGMEPEKVRQVCADAAQGEVCDAANINSPEQLVISGHKAAVERAIVLATERGAKKAVALPVSAPFHSSLMQPAQDRLEKDLSALAFQNPMIPVICNVDAAAVTDAETSRDALVRQVTGAVRWDESIRRLAGKRVETFVEVGPGKVLWGLMRSIDRSKTALQTSDEAALQKTIATLSN